MLTARSAIGADTFGPVSIPWRWSPEARVRALGHAVDRHLPREWSGKVRALARAAMGYRGRGGVVTIEQRRAQCDVLGHWLTEYAGARAADLDESGIRERAAMIAAQAFEQYLSTEPECAELGALLEWWSRLDGFARDHGHVLQRPKDAAAADLRAIGKRLCCARWWRRAVRKWVARSYERGAVELGLIGAQSGQWYCSNRAVDRRLMQRAAAEAAMRATMIESDTGAQVSIWDCAEKSVSNKAIRRGELMTRIKGCEQWADACGLVGIFTTNTAPSRFHSQRKGGGRNPNHDGSTPADAQAWLCSTWARLRAKWHRRGINVFGFRVAEPHHDGCPHWHMLLWCEAQHVEAVEQTMRAEWLRDAGDEPGAATYRVNLKRMQAGGAAGYVAKYVAKNIDAEHVSEHHHGAASVGPDLLGGRTITPAMRVDAWASLWRIRQFQAIGQPPVTVWRELRRVTAQAAAGGSDRITRAWRAAHRERERLADWHLYMRQQGGPMRRRLDYPLCVHRVEREREGRYERVREKWASGVQDRSAGPLGVVPTRRRRWGGRGFAAAQPAAPWTRFNNCTQPRGVNTPALADAAELRARGLLDSDRGNGKSAITAEFISSYRAHERRGVAA